MRLFKYIVLAFLFAVSLFSPLFGQCTSCKPLVTHKYGRELSSSKFSVRDLSQDEVDRRVARLRNQRIKGDYCFKFEVIHYPYRGEEQTYTGYLYGSWKDSGPVYRLYFPDVAGRVSVSEVSATGKSEAVQPQPLQLLIQSGKNPGVWMAEEGKVRQLTAKESVEPILADGVLTPFDLQMPFIYWMHPTYEGSGKSHGRQVYLLLLQPDKYAQDEYPGIRSVRIIVDKNFNALTQVDVLDKYDGIIRSLSVEKLKRIGEEWIIRSLDIKDSKGDRTRFYVLEAAINLNIPSEYFEPNSLLREPYKVNLDLFEDIQEQ